MARRLRRFAPMMLALATGVLLVVALLTSRARVEAAPPPTVNDPVPQVSVIPSEDICPAEMEAEGVFPCAGPCFCDPYQTAPGDPLPPPPPPVTGSPTTVPGAVVTPSAGYHGAVVTPSTNASSGSVNAYTGEFHWAMPLPYYRVPGPAFGTGFWLVYRNQVTIDGITGNWDVTFNQRLIELAPGGDIECMTGTARTGDVFTKTGSVWQEPDGWACSLVQLGGFGGTGNSFRLVEASGNFREYDADGYLVLMGTPSGNTLQLTRNPSALHEVLSILDDTGRTSTLAYTSGRLTSFADPSGAVTTLAYDSITGELASVSTPSVTFVDGTGSTVTRPIVTTFTYSSGYGSSYLNGNLLTIEDDAGHVQISNAYDTSDRVDTQTNALGGVWQFIYMGSATDTYHPNGYKKRTTFDVYGRSVSVQEFTASGMGGTPLRSGEPSSYTTSIVRDVGCACGAPQLITLADGTTWNYTRNTLGQPTQLTVNPGPGVAGGVRVWSWVYAAPFSTTYARLLSATDPSGATRTFAYDTAGRVTTVTEPTVSLGQPSPQTGQTVYQYNAQGLVSQIQAPSGLVTTYTYQAGTGYLLARTLDPTGVASTTSWTVDSAGRPLTRTDPLGSVWTQTFNALGWLTATGQPSGGAGTSVAYDYRGHPVQVDVENRDATGTLDATNPQWTSTWTYNHAGLATASSSEVSSGTFLTGATEWTTWGRLSRSLTPEGRETVISYDERDAVFQVTQAPGTPIAAVQTRDYDSVGRLVRLTDPLSRVTTYVSDAYGAMISSTDPLGIKAEGAFDVAGRLVEALVRDVSGVVVAKTVYSRDERGRIYEQSDLLLDAAGAPTGTTSDVVTLWSVGDEVLERTDPTGRKATATYDALSRLASSTSPGGDVVDITYDLASRPTLARRTELVPGSAAFVWQLHQTFDALGRRASASREDAAGTPHETRTWAYAGRGDLVLTTDGLGNTVSLNYDGLGRTTSVVRELRAGGVGAGSLLGTVTTTTAYDGDGNVVSQTDDNGRTTTHTYDVRGRQTATTLADAAGWTYVYDLASQMLSWTDPNGTGVSQSLDLLGRVTARTITPASGVLGTTAETYAYDALGRMVLATDNDSSVSRVFDSLGRMLSETAGGATPPTSPTTQFTQDLAGRLTGLTYPDATALTRSYDADGRLDLVQSGGSTLIDLDWSGSRIVRRSLGSGAVRGDSTFDAIGRLTRLAWTQQPSGSVLRTLDYAWDAAGRLRYEARADLAGQGDVYAYDSLARIVDTRFQVPNPPAEVASPGSQTWATQALYSLDGAQNRSSATRTQWGLPPLVTSYTSDVRNRYTAIGGAARTYSAKGELLSDGAKTYAYDYRSRLVEVRVAGSGALVATYGWDPLDRRDRRTVAGGVDERHYFAGRDIVAIHELSGGGFRRANLVHGGSGVGPAVAWLRDEADANGNSNTTETVQVLCGQNYAGSLVFAADSAGFELEGYTYDDFGAVSTFDPAGSPRSTSLIALPGRFQGMAYDVETELYRAGPRHYEAATGRWLQMDPLGTWGDPRGLGAESQALAHGPAICADPSGRIVVGIEGAGDPHPDFHANADALANAIKPGSKAAHGNADAGFPPGYSPVSEPQRLARIVAEAIKANPCQPVVIIAHSWGVATATEVARMLKRAGICVDELIAIDGVNGPKSFGPNVPFENPGNITRVTNIESTSNSPSYTGPFDLIPNNADAVKKEGGGFVPVKGKRALPESQTCLSPSRPIGPDDIVNDPPVQVPTEDHQAVSVGTAAAAARAAAAERWRAGKAGRPLGNCCGACK